MTCSDSPTPLFAVLDRRRDGRPRVVGEYRDLKAARDAAVLLRWSGTPAEVVFLSSVRDDGVLANERDRHGEA